MVVDRFLKYYLKSRVKTRLLLCSLFVTAPSWSDRVITPLKDTGKNIFYIYFCTYLNKYEETCGLARCVPTLPLSSTG